jgi:hypothetical protein
MVEYGFSIEENDKAAIEKVFFARAGMTSW